MLEHARTFGSQAKLLQRNSPRNCHDSSTAVCPDRDRPSFEIFGYEVQNATLQEAADFIVGMSTEGRKSAVSFINAECINIMHRSSEYRLALHRFDVRFADGIGVRLAALLSGTRLRGNVNGSDLFPLLCARASEQGQTIYLLGGIPGIASAAATNLATKLGCNPFVGARDGYFGRDQDDAVLDQINRTGADIVLVGLGVPQQEIWIARNKERCAARVMIGVGGLFDYYSGRIPRAPLALRRHGLEWCWRLAMEPRRLADRYIRGNIEFLMRLGALRIADPNFFETIDLDA